MCWFCSINKSQIDKKLLIPVAKNGTPIYWRNHIIMKITHTLLEKWETWFDEMLQGSVLVEILSRTQNEICTRKTIKDYFSLNTYLQNEQPWSPLGNIPSPRILSLTVIWGIFMKGNKWDPMWKETQEVVGHFRTDMFSLIKIQKNYKITKVGWQTKDHSLALSDKERG